MSQVVYFLKMEENVMKKITVNEARKLLELGFYPKCEVSREVFRPVKSMKDLENFLNLAPYQKCQFYGYDKEDIEKFKVPSDAISASDKDAAEMLLSGEIIYAQVIGENEQSFSDLGAFVLFLKKCELHGDTPLLYWRG